MKEQPYIISASTQAELVAALVASGLWIVHENGASPAPGQLVSFMGEGLSGISDAFIRVRVGDETTTPEQDDALLAAVISHIPTPMVNRTGAPLRLIAGGIAPKEGAWPRWAIKFALTLNEDRAAWEAAIVALSTKVDATNAEKLIPDRWAENEYLTLSEPWINRIIAQMRTTLGWTVPQRNQFLNQLKNRATALVAAEQ